MWKRSKNQDGLSRKRIKCTEGVVCRVMMSLKPSSYACVISDQGNLKTVSSTNLKRFPQSDTKILPTYLKSHSKSISNSVE